jgi:hypothetical protein
MFKKYEEMLDVPENREVKVNMPRALLTWLKKASEQP